MHARSLLQLNRRIFNARNLRRARCLIAPTPERRFPPPQRTAEEVDAGVGRRPKLTP
jgi:hypothetical protein